jgi:hypothetical protein
MQSSEDVVSMRNEIKQLDDQVKAAQKLSKSKAQAKERQKLLKIRDAKQRELADLQKEIELDELPDDVQMTGVTDTNANTETTMNDTTPSEASSVTIGASRRPSIAIDESLGPKTADMAKLAQEKLDTETFSLVEERDGIIIHHGRFPRHLIDLEKDCKKVEFDPAEMKWMEMFIGVADEVAAKKKSVIGSSRRLRPSLSVEAPQRSSETIEEPLGNIIEVKNGVMINHGEVPRGAIDLETQGKEAHLHPAVVEQMSKLIRVSKDVEAEKAARRAGNLS